MKQQPARVSTRSIGTSWKQSGVLAVAIALTFTISSCASPAPVQKSPKTAASADMSALITAAQKDGSVTVYTSQTDTVNQAIAEGFNQEYGIRVDNIKLATGPLLERFAGEKRANATSADVIKVVDDNVWTGNPDWFVNFDQKPIPGWKDYPTVAKHTYCADIMYTVGGITYNTDLVDKAHIPTSYKDMIDPYWKGKLLLTDPRATPAYMGWAAAVEKKYGIDFLKQIAAQKPALVESATPGSQQVAAGAYYANLMAHQSNVTAVKADGAPVGWVAMTDVPTGLPTCMGVAAKAPHANAALLFMAWSLTAQGLNVACKGAEFSTPLAAADKCVKLPAGWKPTDLAIMKDPAHQARLVAALGIG